MKNLTSLIILLAVISSAQAFANDGSERKISTIAVLANPGEFDGKEITIQGYLVRNEEYENSLFLDKDAFINRLYDRSIGIAFRSGADALVASYQCDYVMIIGKYSATEGVLGIGQIVSVTKMLPIKKDSCGPSSS